MLTLHRRPADGWKTAAIAPGIEIDVFIRRPNYEQLLAEQTTASGTEAVAIRLHAITDWRSVVDGDGQPVLFSPDAMADLFHAYPGACGRLLHVVRPFFEIEEADLKNSEPPLSAATAPPPPSDSSSVFDVSPPALTPPA